MSRDFRKGRHVVYDMHAHIVLTPKYRKKVMTERVSAIIEEKTREVCINHGCALEEFNTDKDHAHILVSYPPKENLSQLVSAIKSVSSREVRKHHFPEVDNALYGSHFWSPSYCVVSTGGAGIDVVRKYIESQGKD